MERVYRAREWVEEEEWEGKGEGKCLGDSQCKPSPRKFWKQETPVARVRQDLNLLPSDPESDALPNELRVYASSMGARAGLTLAAEGSLTHDEARPQGASQAGHMRPVRR